jgi:tetraacyldisaccharide 4'-kinase
MLLKPKFWDYKKISLLSLVLTPLTLVTVLNNWYLKLYSKKKFNIKTVCVGNIYLGGTGKTPLTIEIYKILKNLKMKTVIIKKKYLDHQDEQNLLKKNGPLIANKSRMAAINSAVDKKYNVAVFDDGLQDKHIKYDLKIVCFDKKSFVGNGKLLPAGPLRQNLNILKNTDFVFFNGPNKLNLEYKKKIKHINKKIKIFETYPKIIKIKKFDLKYKYLIFSGIGNPSNFKYLLKKNNFKIFKTLIFPDHYNYKTNDIKKIKKIAKKHKLRILTTEKDYLRINFDKKNIEFIKIENTIKERKKFVKYIKKFI